MSHTHHLLIPSPVDGHLGIASVLIPSPASLIFLHQSIIYTGVVFLNNTHRGSPYSKSCEGSPATHLQSEVLTSSFRLSLTVVISPLIYFHRCPVWMDSPLGLYSPRGYAPLTLSLKSSRPFGTMDGASAPSTLSLIKIPTILYGNYIPLNCHPYMQREPSGEDACFLFYFSVTFSVTN